MSSTWAFRPSRYLDAAMANRASTFLRPLPNGPKGFPSVTSSAALNNARYPLWSPLMIAASALWLGQSSPEMSPPGLTFCARLRVHQGPGSRGHGGPADEDQQVHRRADR